MWVIREIGSASEVPGIRSVSGHSAYFADLQITDFLHAIRTAVETIQSECREAARDDGTRRRIADHFGIPPKIGYFDTPLVINDATVANKGGAAASARLNVPQSTIRPPLTYRWSLTTPRR